MSKIWNFQNIFLGQPNYRHVSKNITLFKTIIKGFCIIFVFKHFAPAMKFSLNYSLKNNYFYNQNWQCKFENSYFILTRIYNFYFFSYFFILKNPLLQTCVHDSCKFTNFEREEIENSCDVLELTTSDFTVCMNKINKEKPDLSKYECLKDHDFYSKDSAAICDRWENKKDCLRTVTIDICGKDVMKSDEKFLNRFLKDLKCKH